MECTMKVKGIFQKFRFPKEGIGCPFVPFQINAYKKWDLMSNNLSRILCNALFLRPGDRSNGEMSKYVPGNINDEKRVV